MNNHIEKLVLSQNIRIKIHDLIEQEQQNNLEITQEIIDNVWLGGVFNVLMNASLKENTYNKNLNKVVLALKAMRQQYLEQEGENE